MPSKMTAVVGCFHFLAPRLLRRHVGYRAEGCARAREVLGINRRSRRVLWYHYPLTRRMRATLSPKGARAERNGMGQFRQSEVQDLRRAAGSNKDICRLDVAMSDALAMGCV